MLYFFLSCQLLKPVEHCIQGFGEILMDARGIRISRDFSFAPVGYKHRETTPTCLLRGPGMLYSILIRKPTTCIFHIDRHMCFYNTHWSCEQTHRRKHACTVQCIISRYWYWSMAADQAERFNLTKQMKEMCWLWLSCNNQKLALFFWLLSIHCKMVTVNYTVNYGNTICQPYNVNLD